MPLILLLGFVVNISQDCHVYLLNKEPLSSLLHQHITQWTGVYKHASPTTEIQIDPQLP